MTNSELLFRHRLLLLAKAGEVGVARACRVLGYHRSWYCPWKPLVERHGLELLRPRGLRRPRMPNQLPPWVVERVISFALGHPGLGPRRLAAQMRLPMWGGLVVSASGVLKVLHRHGLGTRIQRLALVAGYAAKASTRSAAAPRTPPPRSRTARRSGSDRLLLHWPAERHTRSHVAVLGHRRRQPLRLSRCSRLRGQSRLQALLTALVHRVADELAAAGGKLKAVSTDNGSDFRAETFTRTVAATGATQRIHSRRKTADQRGY